jgi:type III secretion protein V
MLDRLFRISVRRALSSDLASARIAAPSVLLEARLIITEVESEFPELAKEVQRVLPIHKIAEIFQRLVSEEISIRNIRAVMEALIEWGQKEKDSVLLTEYVRVALKRHISHKYSSGQNILPAYLLAPSVEDTVRGAIRQTSGGSYLALDPSVSRKLLDKIKATVGDVTTASSRPVLLTAEVNIQPLAKIEL